MRENPGSELFFPPTARDHEPDTQGNDGHGYRSGSCLTLGIAKPGARRYRLSHSLFGRSRFPRGRHEFSDCKGKADPDVEGRPSRKSYKGTTPRRQPHTRWRFQRPRENTIALSSVSVHSANGMAR